MRFRQWFGPVMEGEGTGGAGGGAAPVVTGGTPSAPFYSSFQDGDLKGYMENKGFDNPESMAKSYRDLEKLRGVPADRLLTLPADEKGDWNQVYDRLGRPKKAEEYEIKAPRGAGTEYTTQMAKKLHELGLSKKQGEGITSFLADVATQGQTAQERQVATDKSAQMASLKEEWGALTEKNADTVDAFVAALGLTEEQQSKMESAVGFDGFAKIMLSAVTKFGIKLGESQFHTGGGVGAGIHSSAGAKAKREELLSDPAYFKAWSTGSKKHIAEIDETFRLEYGSSQI